MLITEVVNVQESYENELLLAVQDLMAMAMSKDIKKISTEKFQNKLKDQGFVASIEEIIQAVEKSGYASSQDSEKMFQSVLDSVYPFAPEQGS